MSDKSEVPAPSLKSRLRLLAIAMVVSALAAAAVAVWAWRDLNQPTTHAGIELHIEAGSSFSTVLRKLVAQEVIQRPLLLKVYDSAEDGRARMTGHSAFENTAAPAGAPPRESIEVRALLSFAPVSGA